MVQIKTPEFPESVYEASVGAWFKSVGDELKAGDAILELHTDKAVQEINAVEDGVLSAILKQVDDVVMPGDALCEVEPAGGQVAVSDEVDAQAEVLEEADVSSEVVDLDTAEDSQVQEPEPETPPTDSDVIRIDVAQPIPMGGSSTTVSEPLAFANVVELEDAGPAEHDVVEMIPEAATTSDVQDDQEEQEEEASIEASVEDPSGESAEDTAELEVPSEDLPAESEAIDEPADDAPADVTEPESAAADASPEDRQILEVREAVGERPVERVRLTRRQITAARRMVQVKQQTVMTTTFNEVDMQQIIEMRARHGERFLSAHGVKLGFMAFFIKATCAALKAFPVLNSEIADDELVLKQYYDVGIAVASDRGLVVPVIRDADSMSFADLESAIRGFAEKASTGAWQLSDLAGGTFTITNGGVFGSMLSTPILNPPQVGILGMHNIVERPIAVDGKVQVRPMMYLALTYDHRIVEGAQAVQCLKHIKDSLESADVLLLGT